MHRIASYKNPNQNNDILTNYLQILTNKAGTKLKQTLQNILDFNLELARKNKWMTKIRSSGLYEIRSNIGRNQQRLILYYDKDIKSYIIINGFNKKTEQISTNKMNQLLELKNEVEKTIQNNPKDCVKPIEPIIQINRKELSKMESKTQNIKNPEFKNHLAIITNNTSENVLTQELKLKPNQLQLLINSPQIENIPRLCKYFNVSADELFQYDNRHTSIPDNPVWNVIRKFSDTHNTSIANMSNDLNIDLAKIDRQIPIDVVFKIADKYKITLNQLFNYQIKQSDSLTQNKNNYHNNLLLFNIKRILKEKYSSITKFGLENNIKPSSIYGFKVAIDFKAVQSLAHHENMLLDQFIFYNIGNKDDLTKNEISPSMQYLQAKYNDNQKVITHLLKQFDLSDNNIRKINHNTSLLAIIKFSDTYAISLDRLLNYDLQPSKLEIEKKNDDESKKAIQNHPEPVKTIIKNDKSNTTAQNKNDIKESNNSRFDRLIKDIKNLNQNQLLIINDLIESWKN